MASNPRDIALAALFVAAGYFTLTFYDLFALRTIGHTEVPYWVAAIAGFTSYSVGHNVGRERIHRGRGALPRSIRPGASMPSRWRKSASLPG